MRRVKPCHDQAEEPAMRSLKFWNVVGGGVDPV